MQLLIGPPGSGKSFRVLGRLGEALRRGDSSVRLLVPTATLARHLQNQMAREGHVLRGSIIGTLYHFMDAFAGGLVQVSTPVLNLIVEEVLRQAAPLEFARMTGLPGFATSLARTIEEFASAGCDSARLARSLPETPLGEAFLGVYREVDRELARRRLATRAARLRQAAAGIAAHGCPGVTTMWLDGFHALPDPELAVIQALSARVDLTVTLTDGPATRATRDRLLAMGAGRIDLPDRPEPATVLVTAASVERETAEIARRILEQHRGGRPFHEIGIIARAPDTYLPLLRATLERFGIPARFYFDDRLDRHPVVRSLAGAVDALLSGWEHAATLAVLRLDPRLADYGAMDRFAFDVQSRLPGSGLGPLKALLLPREGETAPAGHARMVRLLDQLAELEEWLSFTLDPHQWAERFRALRALFHPARPDAADPTLVQAWRSQSTALDLFDEALEEAAAALDDARRIPLDVFWRAARAVLRLKPLRLDDPRRDVVHVVSAPESRQWRLPVVFVCGLVERQFPGFPHADPFFPDAARVRLNQAGIRVRTTADFEVEERALFDSACTRASMLLVLSYPEFDARGERNLPSIFLEGAVLPREAARPVLPTPRAAAAAAPSVTLAAPALLDRVRAATAALGPTTLELYLQCPYKFFGGRTLNLESAPARPWERLDFMLQGIIVHKVLQEWWPQPQPIEPLFDRVFNEICERENVPSGYRTQRLHDAMLEDVRAFTADCRWPPGRLTSRVEEKFNLALDDTLEIRGKIDRIDVDAAGRAWIIDYKYSSRQTTRGKLHKDDLLQAPLYFLAASQCFHLEAAGMYYVGLRGGVEYAGWDTGGAPVRGDGIPDHWTSDAVRQTLQAVEEIRSGNIAPQPSDPESCRRCDYRDVCRYECPAAAAAEKEEGA